MPELDSESSHDLLDRILSRRDEARSGLFKEWVEAQTRFPNPDRIPINEAVTEFLALYGGVEGYRLLRSEGHWDKAEADAVAALGSVRGERLLEEATKKLAHEPPVALKASQVAVPLSKSPAVPAAKGKSQSGLVLGILIFALIAVIFVVGYVMHDQNASTVASPIPPPSPAVTAAPPPSVTEPDSSSTVKYEAVLSCGVGGSQNVINIAACMVGHDSPGSDLDLTNDGTQHIYKAYELQRSLPMAGIVVENDGLHIMLTRQFSIRVRNNSEMLRLSIVIRDVKTGEVTYQKEAGEYGFIGVHN